VNGPIRSVSPAAFTDPARQRRSRLTQTDRQRFSSSCSPLGALDSQIVRLVTDSLADSEDLAKDVGDLARRFTALLMEPQVLRLRRMVLSSANRFHDLGRTWDEQGFERALAASAAAFQGLVNQGLLFTAIRRSPPITLWGCCFGSL